MALPNHLQIISQIIITNYNNLQEWIFKHCVLFLPITFQYVKPFAVTVRSRFQATVLKIWSWKTAAVVLHFVKQQVSLSFLA